MNEYMRKFMENCLVNEKAVYKCLMHRANRKEELADSKRKIEYYIKELAKK